MQEVPVAIIGGSLGGSALALHLARCSIQTLLVDQVEFPRRKACGEGFSLLGLRELEKLGIRDEILALPHAPFFGFRFIEESSGFGMREQELPVESMIGIGIRRWHLDASLIRAAQKTGLVSVQLNSDPQIAIRNSGFEIDTGAEVIRARYLALATGARSTLPRLFGVPEYRRATRRLRCGVCVEVNGDSTRSGGSFPSVSVLLADDFEACCTPTGETTNISLFSAEDGAIFRGRALNALIRRVKDTVGIEGNIAGGPLGAAQIGGIVRPPRHGRIFLLGDAMRQLDPIGGMGMTHALVSARVTAETIAEELAKPYSGFREKGRHTQRIGRELALLRAYTSLNLFSLSSPLGRRTLGRLKATAFARTVLSTLHSSPTDSGRSVLQSAVFSMLPFAKWLEL